MAYDWRENSHERRFGCLGVEASFMGAQIQAAACLFNSNEWKLRSNIPTGWTPPNNSCRPRFSSPRRSKRLLAPKLNWWIVLEKERKRRQVWVLQNWNRVNLLFQHIFQILSRSGKLDSKQVRVASINTQITKPAFFNTAETFFVKGWKNNQEHPWSNSS